MNKFLHAVFSAAIMAATLSLASINSAEAGTDHCGAMTYPASAEPARTKSGAGNVGVYWLSNNCGYPVGNLHTNQDQVRIIYKSNKFGCNANSSDIAPGYWYGAGTQQIIGMGLANGECFAMDQTTPRATHTHGRNLVY